MPTSTALTPGEHTAKINGGDVVYEILGERAISSP